MYILHLQNVPDSADETLIRRYFKDLKISDGGVEIVGGINGDVLINFDDEADILKGLTYGEKPIHGCRIKILLAEAADREKIVAKALNPPRPTKRSKSSRSSNVPESSLPRAASPEGTAFTSHSDVQYPESRHPVSPRANDDPGAGDRDWSAELKAKLLHASNERPLTASEIVMNAGGRDWSAELQTKLSATREQPQRTSEIVKNAGSRDWSAELQTKLFSTREQAQTASDIVKNALLKLNEGQSSDPVEPPYTQPNSDQYGRQHPEGIEEYNAMPPWRSQPGQPPISGPDPTTEMLKNILQSTNTLPHTGPSDIPYSHQMQAPRMSGLIPPQMPPGPPMPPGPRMHPRPPWGAPMMHPHGPLPGHPQIHWPVLPNTRGPPPGPPPFRQRLPVPPRPPLPPSQKVAPSPGPVPVSKNAQALGNAQKQSRWGGMAAGSSVPRPTVVSSKFLIKSTPISHPSGTTRIAKPLLTKGNKATIFTGKISVNKMQNSSIAAKSNASKLRTDAIVIADSDSDSESEIKQKKRKIDAKSDRDKSQRVYRSKRSRSRSRSRGRSRSRSRGRDNSRSRGRDRSRSRGRGRSKSRERGRSRSRGRKRSRSKSRSRSRSRQIRGREQSQSGEMGRRQEKLKNPDRNLPVCGPQIKPVNLEMFKNDPHSVIVQNVAETVTKMIFRDFFYGHPIVKDGLVLMPSEDIPNCQTGYVKFVHQRDVEVVIKMSYTTLDGKKLVIKSCCGKDSEPAPQTTEVASKVAAESLGKGGIRNKPSGSRETIAKLNLEVVRSPAPKNSPFGLLGISDHITSYHVGIRGFKPGTTATEIWSWFGGPDGHVKGIIVSHRIRKDDDEIAFVMYGSKALRNTFKGPKHVPDLVWNRYSEKAVIHKLVGNDVCYLTETTLDGKDREVSKAEIRYLRNFRPDGPTKPGLQQQEKDAPQTESSNLSQNVPGQQTPAGGLAPWKKLFYVCLQETPKDISASKVWSWYGGEKGQAEGVILANCKSKNELKGDRFNMAFVGFKDPAVVQQEIDKRCSGQRYSSDGTMRFLARLPDSGMIFLSTTSGEDRVLPKLERLHLREQYLTREEMLEKTNPGGVQGLPPSWKEFELSEEFGHGLHFLQIREPEMPDLTATKAWSWYPAEKYQTRGSLVLKNANGHIEYAFIAFSHNLTRNKALNDFSSPTGSAWKSSWAFTLRRCSSVLNEEGRAIYISTNRGVDRPITEQEKIYCHKMMKTSAAWNTIICPQDLITDPEEKAKQEARDAAIAAAAAADNSDELFYLNLKRIPPKVTACEVWNWFYGSSGPSKSAIVIYGTNGIAAGAYVGFEKETDRDTERPKQKFSKACNFRSFSVRVLDLMTGFKVTESTTTGVDRVLNDFDLDIMKYKLRKLEGLDKKDGKEAQDSTSFDNTQGNGMKTITRDCQPTHTRVQVKGPQQPSSREHENFKIPSVPKRRFQETVTPAEQSMKVHRKQPQDQSLQGKDVETITPYVQAPWVPVQTKQSQHQQSSLQENKQNLSTWAPVEQKSQPKPQPSNLEPWQKLSYLCLYETPKGNTASQVWSWFGAEKGKAQCVILAHCTSPNELQDGSFHLSFVGFREPCILPKELDRLGKSKWYTPEEAMRFLARLPDDCPIFRALTYGHDRLLSKKIRTGLLDYLTEEERVERHYSEQKPKDTRTATSNLEDFTFSEENVHGMLFVQHRVLPKICTACMVWAWHHRDAGKSKGVILLKEANGTPHSAFVAYEDAKARAEALAKGQFTSKASWTCVVRRVSVLADRGFLVSMSTAHGKDRDPTETERAYMLHIRSTNTTPVNSDPMSTESKPTKVLSTAATITNAASCQQTMTSAIGIDVATAATEDISDQLFYLRIRKLPDNVTACQVWSWFQGASGNSKSAVVVYGANNTTVCAYVGFEKEMHRDLGVTNQKFSKACTYHSRSVFLVDLNPTFKVTESTVAGVDKEFTADDFAVIRYKLQQNAVEKKKQKEGNTNPGPSGQQQPNKDVQLTGMQVSDSNGQPNLKEQSSSYATQSRIVVHTPLQNLKTDISVQQVPVKTPAPMEMSMPVQQTSMEIDKPIQHTPMDTSKSVQHTPMEVGKTVQQTPMEVDKSAQQSKMDIQQLLESVRNLHEAENTVYLRLVKLRPNITAGEIWSWFRGSRGPTRSATLVREGDGTALFAYVGFMSDHTSYLENLELGTFTVCGPKARNIELASLHPSAMVVQSSKQGDKTVLPETLYLFRAGIMGGTTKTGTECQPDN